MTEQLIMDKGESIDVVLQLMAELDYYDTQALNAFDRFGTDAKAIAVNVMLRELPADKRFLILERFSKIEAEWQRKW